MTFDVFLPHYGDTSLMQVAVRSVMAQTDTDWRLTVIDDDRDPAVPEWFAQLGDDRVRYERNERNLGITKNFQKCVSLAESEYMVMMGSDDIMFPNYLAVLRSVVAEYPAIGMIQPGVEVIDGAGEVTSTLTDEVKRRLYAPKISSRQLMGGEELAASLLRGCWFYFPSICWRTDAIQKVNFRDHLKIILDLALVIDLLELGEELVVDPTVCFQYRRHAVSLSAADAVSGTRFTEARNYFIDTAERLDARGWHHASRAARRYLSSRLHACTLLPSAVLAGNKDGVRTLARHAFGPGRRSG